MRFSITVLSLTIAGYLTLMKLLTNKAIFFNHLKSQGRWQGELCPRRYYGILNFMQGPMFLTHSRMALSTVFTP